MTTKAAPHAPHGSAIPAPEHANAFGAGGLHAPRSGRVSGKSHAIPPVFNDILIYIYTYIVLRNTDAMVPPISDLSTLDSKINIYSPHL